MVVMESDDLVAMELVVLAAYLFLLISNVRFSDGNYYYSNNVYS